MHPNVLDGITTVSDQDLPVAKWLERDSTWLVRVKGRVRVESRVLEVRDSSQVTSHKNATRVESRVNTSGYMKNIL